MLIRINGTNIYILEQQHKNSDSVSTDIVESASSPEVWFIGGSIRKIYIRGSSPKYDNNPLECNTIQNLNIALKHLSDWCNINNEPLHIRLNHRT